MNNANHNNNDNNGQRPHTDTTAGPTVPPPATATAPPPTTPASTEALFTQRLQRIPLFNPNMTEDDFFRCLSSFLSLFGFPLHRFPSIQGRPIAMKYLFLVVLSQGGFEKVDQARLWPQIDEKMGFPPAPSLAMSVSRTHYYGLLYVYEQYYIQRRPVNQLTYPLNWYRSQPQQQQQQQQQPIMMNRGPPPTARSGPQTPMAGPPLPSASATATPQQQQLQQQQQQQQQQTEERPTKSKERVSYWQQLAVATKPFRIPTTLGDLGAVSLKAIHLSLSSGSRFEETRALNTLQCLVHPGRLNDKDIAISLPPNAPYLREIVIYLITALQEELQAMPRMTMEKLHIYNLSHRFQLSPLPQCHDRLEIVENVLRGLSCGEGKSSLILFEQSVRSRLLPVLIDAVTRPASPRSFTNNLVTLSRLCTGVGTMSNEQLSVLLDLVNDELAFCGPIIAEAAAQPRFSVNVDYEVAGRTTVEEHVKNFINGREKIAYLTNFIPGHIYLLLYTVCLLQCNLEQNKVEWQPQAERLSLMVSLMFKYIVQPLLPTYSSVMMSVKYLLTASKRSFMDHIAMSIKDGGYVELVLMICWYATGNKNLVMPDAVLPSLLTLLDGIFHAYSPTTTSATSLEGMQRHTATAHSNDHFLDVSESHPQQILARSLDILKRMAEECGESVGRTLVGMGYFERLFEWVDACERLVLVECGAVAAIEAAIEACAIVSL